MKLLAVALVLAVAVAIEPTFPSDWSAGQSDAVIINQGGVVNPDGSVCCPAQGTCKIQAEYEAGMQYWDTTNQRTAFKLPDGSGTVSLYADGKEYQVDASGACQAFCPLLDTKLTPFAIDPNATDMGDATYNGQAVHEWQWNETAPIFGTVQQNTFYARKGADGTFIPVAELSEITPFGENLGNENSTFFNFKAGTPPAAVFTVTGKTGDNCKQAQGCNGEDDDSGDDGGMPPARRLSTDARRDYFVSSLRHQAYQAWRVTEEEF